MALNYRDLSSIIYQEDSTFPSLSDEPSDSHSLPAISAASGTGNGQAGGEHAMNIKEYEAKLNELRRENFDLKLRLYLIEKEKCGIIDKECESALQRELNRQEKTIRTLTKAVEDKGQTIKNLKSHYEKLLASKCAELEAVLEEKKALEKVVSKQVVVADKILTKANKFLKD